MSYSLKARRKYPSIPLIWRIILFFQAAMTAWIGFTHGSGIEVYLFRFADWNSKSVYALDHNLAGVIAFLGVLVLFRAHGFFLTLLSMLYLFERLLMSRFGSYVDNPYPLFGSAVHIILPLAVFAVHKHRWAHRLLRLAILSCLLSYTIYFLTGPLYFVDIIIHGSYLFGSAAMLGENQARILLGGAGIALLLSFFAPSKTAFGPMVISFFAIILTIDTVLKFGLGYLPESLLKLTLLFGIWLYWQADPLRKSRGPYPTLGGSYA